MSKRFRVALSALVLAALLIFFADAGELWHALRGLDMRWAVLAALIMLGDRLLMAYKWLLLLAARGYRVSLLDGTSLYCSAMLWGIALPVTIGADVMRTLSLRQWGVQMSDAVSSIVVERGIGMLTALALALVGLLALMQFWPNEVALGPWLILGAAAFLGAVLLFALSFNERAFALARQALPPSWRDSSVTRGFARLHDAYRSLGARPLLIATFVLLTLLEQLFAVPFNWAVGRALGLDLPWIVLIGALPLALLVSRLPVSFEGIGVFEGIFMAIMSQAGVPPAQALAIALVSRVLVILVLLPWWIAHTVRSGLPHPRAP